MSTGTAVEARLEGCDDVGVDVGGVDVGGVDVGGVDVGASDVLVEEAVATPLMGAAEVAGVLLLSDPDPQAPSVTASTRRVATTNGVRRTV